MSEQTKTVHFYDEGERLPDDLPSSPFSIFKQWFDQAWDERITPNANAMTISFAEENVALPIQIERAAKREKMPTILERTDDTRS